MKHKTEVIVETPRLRLRQWCEEDRALIRAMGADARVMRYFASTQNDAQSDEFFERMRTRIDEHGFGFWAAELRTTGETIGIIGLMYSRFVLPFPQTEPEIGWRLHPDFWGKGYATEGAKAALDFGFVTLGKPRLWAVTAVQNLPSRAVMERVGMHNANLDFDHPAVATDSHVLRHCAYCITREQYDALPT
jgi:RimJ/RimL family protein N-acetyltransferase